MKNKELFKKIGKIALRVGAFLGSFLLAAVLTVAISLSMICSDAFPSAQQMFVTTILETGQLKFLASIFLSADEIQEIVDKNSMKQLNAEVDSDLIQIGDNTNTDEKDIEVTEVSGATFSGTMMIIKDPSRVSLATIYPWKEMGVTLDELVKSNGAVAGINGAAYGDWSFANIPLGSQIFQQKRDNWLYHYDTMMLNTTLINGLADAGIASSVYYEDVYPNTCFNIPVEPREALAVDMYIGVLGSTADNELFNGVVAGAYDYGKGTIFVHTFRIMDTLGTPVADRMLLNMVDYVVNEC